MGGRQTITREGPCSRRAAPTRPRTRRAHEGRRGDKAKDAKTQVQDAARRAGQTLRDKVAPAAAGEGPGRAGLGGAEGVRGGRGRRTEGRGCGGQGAAGRRGRPGQDRGRPAAAAGRGRERRGRRGRRHECGRASRRARRPPSTAKSRAPTRSPWPRATRSPRRSAARRRCSCSSPRSPPGCRGDGGDEEPWPPRTTRGPSPRAATRARPAGRRRRGPPRSRSGWTRWTPEDALDLSDDTEVPVERRRRGGREAEDAKAKAKDRVQEKPAHRPPRRVAQLSPA